MEKVELDPAIIQGVAGKGRVLSDDQIKMLMKAGNMNIEEVMKRSGQTREQVISNYTAIVEAYVRIKFATFQPKQTDDPDVPPTFPIIIPPLMAELFNAQKDFPFMCQYLIAAYATVDTTLSRPDLPASIVWHHMCPMCKVTDCLFHTKNRKSSE